MPYIGTSPSNGVRRVYTYTATASQTTFSGASNEGSTLAYVDNNYLDVYQNGILLGSADYTSTNGTSVVLAQAASVNDIIVIVAYDVFGVADTVSKKDGGTFDGNIAMGGTLSVTGTPTFTSKIATTNFGTGAILQVNQTVKTDSFSTNSSGAPLSTPIIVTGLSVNITPSSSSNKVLVEWNLSVGHDIDTGHTYLFLRRGTTTNILVGDTASNRTGATHVVNSTASGEMHVLAGQFLDSPSTTSATTYAFYIATTSSSGCGVNRSFRDNDATNFDGRATSSITAMEVSG